MKKNKLYPYEPYIETCYGNTALWIRSLALHPKRCIPSRPDKDMSKHEEKCYDKIINAAISEAKEGDLRMFTTHPHKVKEPIMVESEEEEQDYHGHFYHPWVNSGKYREVWQAGQYSKGIRVSPSLFSREIQSLITLDKVLVINKDD